MREEQLGHHCVIDESGEEYLYPIDRFPPADLLTATRRPVLQVA